MIQLLTSHLPVFVTPIGALRMLLVPHLQMVDLFQSRNLTLFLVLFSFMVVVLYYGICIRNLTSVAVLVRLKLKLLMNASRMLRCFVT
jgi:hypothetical protein